MQKVYRYACVGAGQIAQKKHLEILNKMKNIDVVGVCDIDIKKAKQVADQMNIHKIYADYEEMFKYEPLDFISICTPNFTHYDIAYSALTSGINIICEKPFCINASETKQLVDYSRQCGRKVMVRMNNRFTEEADFTKRYIQSGEMGEIYHAKCGWIRRNGIPGSGSWFTNNRMSGGGCMIDLGVHMLDLLLYFIGYPSARSISGACFKKFDHMETRNRQGYISHGTGIFDVEDLAVGMIRLDNGITIDFEFGWAVNIEKECKYYELYGTKGGIKKTADESIKIFTEINDALVDVTPVTYSMPQTQNEFMHFVESLDSDIQPLVRLDEMLELSKIIDGFYQSCSLSQEVAIETIEYGGSMK